MGPVGAENILWWIMRRLASTIVHYYMRCFGAMSDPGRALEKKTRHFLPILRLMEVILGHVEVVLGATWGHVGHLEAMLSLSVVAILAPKPIWESTIWRFFASPSKKELRRRPLTDVTAGGWIFQFATVQERLSLPWMAPIWPQDSLNLTLEFQLGSTWPQPCPKMAQHGPTCPQDGFNKPSRGLHGLTSCRMACTYLGPAVPRCDMVG